MKFLCATSAALLLGAAAASDDVQVYDTVTVSADSVSGPRSVLAADLNGDGYDDAVVCASSSNTISVHLNDGSGGYGSETVVYSVPGWADPYYADVVDYDGDGTLDIVAAMADYGYLFVFTNPNGDGETWSAPSYTYSPSVSEDSSGEVRVGDVNGDGHPDIVQALYNNKLLSWFDIASETWTELEVDWKPQRVQLGDMNNDGNLDIVAGSTGGNTVGVFLGDGEGGFAEAWTEEIYACDIDLGDGNHDGWLDAVVSSCSGDTGVRFLKNRGDDVDDFEMWVYELDDGVAHASVFTNVDREDGLDIVSVSWTDSEVSYFLNGGAPSSQWAMWGYGDRETLVSGDAFDGVNAICAVDADQDGLDEFLVTMYSADDPVLLLDIDGKGTAASPVAATSVASELGDDVVAIASGDMEGPRSVVTADMNGDGHLDLVVCASISDTVTVHLNDGRGNYKAVGTHTVYTNPHWFSPYWSAVLDVDDDGDLDIVAAGPGWKGLMVLYNDDGSAESWSGPDYLWCDSWYDGDKGGNVVAADMNNDGRLDIVQAGSENKKFAWYDFAAQEWTSHSTDFYVNVIAVDDIDNDGHLDVVAGGQGSYTLAVFYNDGDGASFTEDEDAREDMYVCGISTGDCDGDNFADILVSSCAAESRGVYLFRHLAGRTWDEAARYLVKYTLNDAEPFNSAAFVHLDTENDVDVVAVSWAEAKASFWLNEGYDADGWQPHWEAGEEKLLLASDTALNGANWVSVADTDSDGLEELLVSVFYGGDDGDESVLVVNVDTASAPSVASAAAASSATSSSSSSSSSALMAGLLAVGGVLVVGAVVVNKRRNGGAPKYSPVPVQV